MRTPNRVMILLVFGSVMADPNVLCSQSSIDEGSCRAFVQHFYDWYWNQLADKADDPRFDPRELHSYHEVVQIHPALLSAQLMRLFERDERLSEKAHGIANLDFDPFLNSQAQEGHYSVNKVMLSNGRCLAHIERGHLNAELKKTGEGWVFTNFYYSLYSDDGKTKQAPDSNLIEILSQ